MQIHFKKPLDILSMTLKSIWKVLIKNITTKCQETFSKKQFLKHIFWESNFKAVSLFQKYDFKRKKWNIVNYKDYKKN